MGKTERKGARRDWTQRVSKRIPELGYYIIITDTKATEKNYLYGFRDTIPQSIRDRLVIKVSSAPTSELLKKSLEITAIEPQYRKPWIVFDKDEVPNFDKIISDAGDYGVEVGWSNPCIEVWFQAYFGEMPIYQTSMQCNSGFGKVYKDKTGQIYNKAAQDNYQKLHQYGDEEQAILIAKSKHHQQIISFMKPSEMLSTTTLYCLISEIKKQLI